MNEEQKVQSNMAAQEEQINIADLLLILRNNWKWFAASIFVCMDRIMICRPGGPQVRFPV